MARDRFRQLSSHGLQLGIALGVAIALRLLLWNHIPRSGLISDEGEYIAAATWLAQGRNFSWYQGYLWTRAPLYPLFVAAHFALFGRSPIPVYLTQNALSLMNVALVYLLGARVLGVSGQVSAVTNRTNATQILGVNHLMPLIAALLMALYFPFAVYTQVLLSETLFLALLLGGFLALSYAGEPRPFAWPFVLGGVLLGLATLTRSLTLAFLPIVVIWLVAQAGRSMRGAGQGSAARVWRMLRPRSGTAAFALAAALVILPWTVYNSVKLYGGLVVADTTGAYNLLLGGRTAFDGERRDAPPRNFALALLDPALTPEQRKALLSPALATGGSCLYHQPDPRLRAALERPPNSMLAQAKVQQLMIAEGLCLIGKQPLAFAQKTAGELLDFFQINYSGDERFSDGFALGRLPRTYTLGLFLLDDTLYVFVLPLAALGMGLALRAAREFKIQNSEFIIADVRSFFTLNFSLLILLWWLFNIVVAPLLFAINRFRLPLLPFAFIYAAYALVVLPRAGWDWLRTRGGMLSSVAALALVLVAATPYAYVEPRAPDAPSRWASYLGPYPSSVASTLLALVYRPDYERQEQMRLALRTGDLAAASAARPEVIRLKRAAKKAADDAQIVDALFAGAAGKPANALALLPAQHVITSTRDVEAAVVRGDLLRSLGRTAEANALLTEQFVDLANPVQWAWDWLHPAPADTINIGGNLDLGYVRGCYLGEGERDANYRWCGDGAQLRFPNAGTGTPQTLTLRADGRGWQNYAPTVPPVRVLLGETEIGSFTPSAAGPANFSLRLPATVHGADVVVTLQTPTFVPPANDFNRQQGALAGEGRQLGVRLDWAELGSEK